MICPKCKARIVDDAKFCSYCGERISSYEDPFASYRDHSLDKDKMSYSQTDKKEIHYVDSPRDKQQLKIDNRFSYLAIFLSIMAIPLCFFNWGLGLLLAFVAFVLCLVNVKRASNGVKVASLLVSIFGGVITIIVSTFLIVFSLQLVLDNGYSTTVGNYLKDSFMTGYQEYKIYGNWVTEDNQLLYLSDERDCYYLYLDRKNTTNQYLTGSIEVDDGYLLSNDGDRIYADGDYYYYWVDTSFNKEYIEENSSLSSYFQNGFLLKLDKKDQNSMILFSPFTMESMEFKREQSTV